MIIFNTTYHIEDSVRADFLDFMRESFVPKAMESGFLLDARLTRIISQHQEPGISYSLQFRVKNNDTLDLWLSCFGNKLIDMLTKRFGDKVVGFVTLLEEISLDD